MLFSLLMKFYPIQLLDWFEYSLSSVDDCFPYLCSGIIICFWWFFCYKDFTISISFGDLYQIILDIFDWKKLLKSCVSLFELHSYSSKIFIWIKLSEAFKKIKPAKCIRVTAKGITEIDIVHSSYSIIQELFLQDNRLKSISNISQFPNLTRIALENNAISDIEELEDIRNLPNLKEVRLKGNPICNIPLFHQQIANFFEDYIIIDSKRVQFTKNKAKYENYIIFSIFISDFFTKIQKKPKIDFLTSQLNIVTYFLWKMLFLTENF